MKDRIETLQIQRETSMRLTAAGPPCPTSNPFFGVGPITDMTADEAERRFLGFEFQRWLEKNYRKISESGQDLGPITKGELDRGMHRGYPADKVVLDMMRGIHRYFRFPKQNRMAVGLGGGHNGFTVCILHLIHPKNTAQQIFVDTPQPESKAAQQGGFFRQSWGTQLIELLRSSAKGKDNRLHFSELEGQIPTPHQLHSWGIQLFMGVGHETTGATTYSNQDIRNLLAWIDLNPQNHHAVIDGTSMVGAMPWPEELGKQIMDKCCIFMPFQKAVGGIPGYFVASFTPAALQLVEHNMKDPGWAIPRHLKIAVPENPQMPLSGKQTTELGPIYDAVQDKMLGGIINTFSNNAFAETTFGLLEMEKRIGDVSNLNRRSVMNRQRINDWVAAHPLFDLGVRDESRRGAAVTLLKVKDPDITVPVMHDRIIAKTKQLLGFEGISHPSGDHENGLDVARYVNPFPGTPGDFRAWIGGTRSASDITALLENLEYSYHRAKIVVLEEELAQLGVRVSAPPIQQYQRRTKSSSTIPETKVTNPLPREASEEIRHFSEKFCQQEFADKMRHSTESQAAIWGALSSIEDPARRAELIERHAAQLLQISNEYAALMKELGI